MAYHGDGLVDEVLHDLQQLRALRQRFRMVWINVTGLGDATTIQQLGELFQLHSLALEDVVNVHQRAKVDAYDGLSRMVNRNDATVEAVFVSGREVFRDGQPTEILGRERTGGFLRADGRPRNVPQAVTA